MFIYNVVFDGSIADGTTTSQNVNIGSEPFELHEIRSSEVNNVLVKIRKADGTLYSTTAFNSANIGKGNNGLRLTVPYIIDPNTQITVEITNKSGATVNYFEVDFIGQKVVV
ncbi:hypothetical protein MROS_2525 [Melioribacter roseus P3M-2]|jgi:hypothetical protein|uniref:Uncharacterized protein n=1 Tax=Melioribacter roseus (strain DSM 23840 / JCM 17771 / VKM B-2668 / P3M-2) TaxID=1191523 RepID=I6Z9E0_MELRP|nr:hypothetical protein [Melioribacter roseus]AFN75755.1 hypothetical protein MROS_2525 [Melioribacter roseus P3M-2]